MTSDSLLKEQRARDKRQLILQKEMLAQPSLKFSALGHLLNNLSALVGELELVDREWKEDFIGTWWIIEDLYAHSLDKNKPEFDPDHAARVQDALERLRKMVDDKLSQYDDVET